MKRKFTKGPWNFDMAVDAYNKGKETFAIYSHPAEGHTVEIIETPDNYGDDCIHGIDVTEKMANANLIAAAPELLEALEQALNWHLGDKWREGDQKQWAEWAHQRDVIQSAIKKAYGEKP